MEEPRPEPGRRDNYTLYAEFRDASGLPKGSKVVVAGIPQGEVIRLEVEGRYAKVTFRLSDDIKVWSSGVVIKKATSLLGDNYLEIDPARRPSSSPTAASIVHAARTLVRDTMTVIRPSPTPAARCPT